jgi:hypothetical protein
VEIYFDVAVAWWLRSLNWETLERNWKWSISAHSVDRLWKPHKTAQSEKGRAKIQGELNFELRHLIFLGPRYGTFLCYPSVTLYVCVCVKVVSIFFKFVYPWLGAAIIPIALCTLTSWPKVWSLTAVLISFPATKVDKVTFYARAIYEGQIKTASGGTKFWTSAPNIFGPSVWNFPMSPFWHVVCVGVCVCVCVCVCVKVVSIFFNLYTPDWAQL